MRQELIDLLAGELSETEARALQDRLAKEPELARELDELQSLSRLMRCHEEVEPSPSLRTSIFAAASRAVRPTLIQAMRAIPACSVSGSAARWPSAWRRSRSART